MELNKIVELKVDVSELLTRGEEIRLKMWDVMRWTQMEWMRKRQELEVPPMCAWWVSWRSDVGGA